MLGGGGSKNSLKFEDVIFRPSLHGMVRKWVSDREGRITIGSLLKIKLGKV